MNTNILDYLEATAGKFPDKIAFSDEHNKISFSQLVQRAKLLASSIILLTENSIRQPIAVLVDRNIESIISFIAVLYSGNFYAPLDSKSPYQRIELLLSILNPPLVIEISDVDTAIIENIKYTGKRLRYNDSTSVGLAKEKIQKIRDTVIDVDPAYSIFTSGSTGIPKGVVINHRALIDLTEWLVQTFKFTEKEIIGNQTPFYFDGSVKDIYITIATGATLHIIGRKYFSFPKLLIDYLNAKRITSILWATSAIILVGNSKILEEQNIQFIKKVFFAGEAMPSKQLNYWRKHLPECMFVNLYGPTEATVDCTYYIVDKEFSDNEFIPIGKPCKNKEILVLNKHNQLCRIEEPGELCIRGTGLAIGYFGNPDKTQEVFVQNPLHNNYQDQIYRTGDIVKINQQGDILFLSRKDFQIKHMGNRIELGEIEVTVNALENILNAACIYDHDRQKIILFYSTADNVKIDIINSIKPFLPKYMFPNEIIFLEDFPYNSNGKIDRLKLNELYRNDIN